MIVKNTLILDEYINKKKIIVNIHPMASTSVVI